MECTENIYDKLREILGNFSANVAVMQEETDADLLGEYLDVSGKLPAQPDLDLILGKKKELFNPRASLIEKKKYLAQLAQTGSVQSYRIIEDYILQSAGEIKSWAVIALHENRMLLESELLEENQVLISTGLGAKGSKIRYFTVLQSKSGNDFTATEKRLIRTELAFNLKIHESECESIRFNRELCRIISVIPLHIAVQAIFDEIIEACNGYNQFIDGEYLITNVKLLSGKQIRKITQGGK